MQAILAAVAIVALLFVAVLASTVIGGIVGWIVGAVFPFVIEALNQLTGLQLTGFETGAVLGFVGAFFRSVASSSK
jgi:membrane protein YqaA with SNARE-associated domain